MRKKKPTPKIFLSYSWRDQEESATIEKDFDRIGIPLIKDTINLKYKDSISEFMTKIRDSDFAVLMISDNYLKSKNCLIEALEILKEQNHKEKTLPVLIKKPEIFSAENRIYYINYWKGQKEELEKKLEGIVPTKALESFADLKQIEQIFSSIDGFLKTIGDQKSLSLNQLKKENYKSIIDHLGFDDVSFAIDLLVISKITNLNFKEHALGQHLKTFGKSPHYLFSLAKTKADSGQHREAMILYKECLSTDPKYISALNNLGYLMDTAFDNQTEAMIYLKKAVKLSPGMIVARINLANVLTKKGQGEKAKKEYLTILELDPFEPKAHNNIANKYRREGNNDKAIFHFKEAIKIKPDYVEAYFNLANLYDMTLDDRNNAIKYYTLTKQIANRNNVNKLVDRMIAMMEKRKDASQVSKGESQP